MLDQAIHFHTTFRLAHRIQTNLHDSDEAKKKADVAEYPQVFGHVGLLVNEPSSRCWNALHLVIRRRSNQFSSQKRFL
jgi:hypothetical protein